MKRYRVLLPVEIGGRVYQFGEVVELNMKTAKEYGHALSAMAEEKSDGRHE
jgi:hypothetical protein